MGNLPVLARIYIAVVASAGFSSLAVGIWFWKSEKPSRFLVYLAASLLCSGLKVRLPGIQGTMSVNYLVFVAGFIQLSLPETLMLGLASCLLQSFWHAKERPRAIQVIFNITGIAIAITGGYSIYHLDSARLAGFEIHPILRLAFATCGYYLLNTVLMAVVFALTEHRGVFATWKDSYFWSLPYYLIGASIADAPILLNKDWDWQMVLLVGPVVYAVYRSFRLYLERIEDEKIHALETAGLHLRTIEALALAIEAKDDTTHEHLRRVQVYATEIGLELKLTSLEMQALQAAAILHDIGKLAVPDYIISKPGKLTPEEFEKMKVHPVVGAEILDQVRFPYPVAPIVRSHHEKWDGSGYPLGMVGDAIPIGARIISAVDCLDALASDRQYRRAMPLEKALEIVVSESGKSFDPKIVEIIQRRAQELEKKARAESAGEAPPVKLSKDLKIERGLAPGAGFEETAGADRATGGAFPNGDAAYSLAGVATAQQQMRALYDFTHNEGSSLNGYETLSLLCARLQRLVPHDCVAIYVRHGQRLRACCAHGENSRLFASLEIPVGQGLSGWVVENNKPVINGNPGVEPGYLNDASKFTTLRSALALPLRAEGGTHIVVALYALEKEFFSKDQLALLLGVGDQLAMTIEHALLYPHGETPKPTLFLVPDPKMAPSRK